MPCVKVNNNYFLVSDIEAFNHFKEFVWRNPNRSEGRPKCTVGLNQIKAPIIENNYVCNYDVKNGA